MKDVLQFFLDYYQFIFLGISCLISLSVLIVSIVKGKGNLAPALLMLVLKLPTFIKDAEATGKDGVNKYTQVFTSCVKYLCFLTKLSSSKVVNKYGSLIDNSIEDILSTPTKKGK